MTRNDVIHKFCQGENARRGNWRSEGNILFLFGKPIAEWKPGGELIIRDCGWRTVTTKYGLNAIFRHIHIAVGIYQSRREWYLRIGGHFDKAWEVIEWPGEWAMMPYLAKSFQYSLFN